MENKRAQKVLGFARANMAPFWSNKIATAN